MTPFPSPSCNIAQALAQVQQRIAQAVAQAGRPANSVRLLAVSKTFPANAVASAVRAGQTSFGENYVQEGIAKAAELQGLQLEWHFIGPLQSNKTRRVAETFDWVHSIDRLKIAERLSEQRPDSLAPLQVCLQVNVSGEDTKSGVALEEAPELAKRIALLPRLKLRGLMAIPAPVEDFSLQRLAFRRLREIFEQLNRSGLPIDTLSMGMSHDLEAAIAEGATMVRVGTAIFGERTKA